MLNIFRKKNILILLKLLREYILLLLFTSAIFYVYLYYVLIFSHILSLLTNAHALIKHLRALSIHLAIWRRYEKVWLWTISVVLLRLFLSLSLFCSFFIYRFISFQPITNLFMYYLSDFIYFLIVLFM